MGNNREFADKIVRKYESQMPEFYRSLLVYRKQAGTVNKVDIYQNISRQLTQKFYERISQYEKRYYQTVTNQDNRKWLSTMEHIYNQPGDKKQLIHLFQKLGVVTKSQKDWQETRQILKRYEEELIKLKKQVNLSEEHYQKKEIEVPQQASAKQIKQEIIDSIKREIRLERIRYGLD